MGVEPTYAAWEAAVLPMNYSRIIGLYYNSSFHKKQDENLHVPYVFCVNDFVRRQFHRLYLRPAARQDKIRSAESDLKRGEI